VLVESRPPTSSLRPHLTSLTFQQRTGKDGRKRGFAQPVSDLHFIYGWGLYHLQLRPSGSSFWIFVRHVHFPHPHPHPTSRTASLAQPDRLLPPSALHLAPSEYPNLPLLRAASRCVRIADRLRSRMEQTIAMVHLSQ
jgi:hypothetical protein